MVQKPSQSIDFFGEFSLLILLTLCFLITFIIRYRLIFLESSDIGGIESNVIYSIQRYLAGYPLYSNPEITPYSITQYSPLYYRLVAAIGHLLNLDPDNSLTIYRLSRVISLLANLLYTLLLVAIGIRFRLNLKIASTVAIIGFLLLPPQTYSRPDSIYIVFVIATLYSGVRSLQAGNLYRQYMWLGCAIGLAALAIATKQSGIVLPLILTSYYALILGQWLKAFVLGTSIGVLALLLLIGLMPEHDPALLYANIVLGVSQGLDWVSFKTNIVDHYLRPFSLYNALGLTLSIGLIRQSKADLRWLGWFVFVLFGFALLTSLKQGSALNYFTEYVSLTGLVTAIWLRNYYETLHNLIPIWLVVFSGIVWTVIPNMPNFNWLLALKRNALSDQPYYTQKLIAKYVTDSLKLQPTDAVFITNQNYCYLNSLLYKNCILPQQEIVMVMYPSKLLDYSAFDQQVKQGDIRFLITRSHETSTPFPGLTTANYTLRHHFSEFDVYERGAISTTQ